MVGWRIILVIGVKGVVIESHVYMSAVFQKCQGVWRLDGYLRIQVTTFVLDFVPLKTVYHTYHSWLGICDSYARQRNLYVQAVKRKQLIPSYSRPTELMISDSFIRRSQPKPDL